MVQVKQKKDVKRCEAAAGASENLLFSGVPWPSGVNHKSSGSWKLSSNREMGATGAIANCLR